MTGLVAFALSLSLTPVVLVALRRSDVLDHPNERSSHDQPVVRGGGIAFALACLVAVLIVERSIPRVGVGVLIGAALLGLIGLAEDIWGVPTGPRFMFQIVAASVALAWLLDGLSGPIAWRLVFAGGCLVALSSYANAFNFMDGINGISAVQSLAAGATWAWLGHARDADVLVWGGLALAGASLGFLPYNFPQARLFLGDSGSYFIGGWQAALVIAGLRAGLPPEAVGAPLAIYLADTGTTLLKRIKAGDVWHQPHREHAYQRLIRQGWSHVRTTALVGLAVTICCLLGRMTIGSLAARAAADVLLAATVLAYLALPSPGCEGTGSRRPAGVMRIVLVSHFFPPEVGAPQARMNALSQAWAASGDEVTVLTGFPNHPTGIVPDGYRGKLRMEEQLDGVRVVRTWLYATPNERVLRKTLGHISFMISGVLLGTRRVGKTDVVIASSPTFFSILSGWVIARIKRAAFVVEIRDLWPKFIVELGVLKNRWAIALLERIELAAYRACDAVVTVSNGFRDEIVARGIASEKIHVIPNGVVVDQFARTSVVDETLRRKLGAREHDTLVLYAGAHGVTYALGDVVEVAAAMTDEPVHFTFVGEGPTKASLVARVAELGLSNVTLLPSVPHDAMPAVLGAADICLVPDRKLDFLETVIRAKIFEYMAAGKPIIGAIAGEGAKILSDAGSVVIAPEDRGQLERAIRDLMSDPERRHAIGAAGRDFVGLRYDRGVLAATYRALLTDVLGKR